MNENLIKTCRFCLYKEKYNDVNKVLDIFQSELFKDLDKKIRSYTQIEISPGDKIPPNICMKCVDCIVDFDKFLKSCWKSDKILRELYMSDDTNKNIKSENIKHNEHNFESTLEINKTLTNSDTNEEDNFKSEDTTSDDLIEYSDSDISSCIKEEKTEVESSKEGKAKVTEVDEKIKIIGDNTYTCSICSKQFESFFEYQDHQETHNGQLVFSCTKCNQVFSKRKELVEHDANHKIACQVCSKMVLPKSLSAHLKKHTDIHRCIECNLSHTSKTSLEKHIKARHIGQKGLVCHICGKQSSCQSSLNRHLAYHNSKRPYRCKHCDFSAKSRSILKVHVSRKHLCMQKPCGECGKVFKSEISLKQHATRMHNPRKHICHVCQKAFAEKHSLHKHVSRKHSKQSLYECNVCDGEFHTIRQLKEHMHSHRQGCVSCPNCGKKFFYKKYLERHMTRCVPLSEEGSVKERLYRLKSTISLPSSSVLMEKLASF